MKALLLVLIVGAGQSKVVPFLSEDGSFSFHFPGPPIHDVLSVPTPTGPQLRHVFRYSDDELVIFVWQVCTPPPSLPADPEEALDLARLEAHKTIGSTTISERRISVNGRPGREFVDELAGQRSVGRTVLGYKGAFFSVGVSARSKVAEGKARELLLSFSVLPPSPRSVCQAK
jgi:hypothetical protein